MYSSFLPFETHKQSLHLSNWWSSASKHLPCLWACLAFRFLSGLQHDFQFQPLKPLNSKWTKHTNQSGKSFFFPECFCKPPSFSAFSSIFSDLVLWKPLQIPLFGWHLLQIFLLLRPYRFTTSLQTNSWKLKLWMWRWGSSGRASVTSPFVVAVLALLFTWSTCGIFPNLSECVRAFFWKPSLDFYHGDHPKPQKSD